MIETSLKVKLDTPSLTGEEIQRMAVGILMHNGILPEGQWPQRKVFIDITPNPDNECYPTFLVRLCENEEDEREVIQLKQLLECADFDLEDHGTLHFEMMPTAS